jgi:hypothetical protein
MSKRYWNDWGLGRLWKVWLGSAQQQVESVSPRQSSSPDQKHDDSWTNLLPSYYTAELEAGVEKTIRFRLWLAEFETLRKIVFQ